MAAMHHDSTSIETILKSQHVDEISENKIKSTLMAAVSEKDSKSIQIILNSQIAGKISVNNLSDLFLNAAIKRDSLSVQAFLNSQCSDKIPSASLNQAYFNACRHGRISIARIIFIHSCLKFRLWLLAQICMVTFCFLIPDFLIGCVFFSVLSLVDILQNFIKKCAKTVKSNCDFLLRGLFRSIFDE